MLAVQLHGEAGIWRSLRAEEGPELYPPGQASRDSEQTPSFWECQTLALGSGGLASLHTDRLGDCSRWVGKNN